MKIKQARKDLRKMQETFNSVLANPSYDSQIQQIDEVEKLKIELARKGIQVPIDTLKRGLVLPEREDQRYEDEKRYLRGDEFLLKNPYRKVKLKMTTKKSKKRSGTTSKSPTKMKRKGSDADDIGI